MAGSSVTRTTLPIMPPCSVEKPLQVSHKEARHQNSQQQSEGIAVVLFYKREFK